MTVRAASAVVALVLCAAVVHAQTNQPVDRAQAGTAERAASLANELRCLVCQNQSIADSNADLAVDLRRQIREQIAAGKSDAEIRDYMVARYGDFVLYRPPMKATTMALWLGPVALLLAGFWALRRVVRTRAMQRETLPLSAEERERAVRLLGAGDRKDRT